MNNQDNLLKIAIQCLKLGWSLIPVGPDKRPLVVWKEFQTRRATEDEILEWFVKYPDMQLGVVTGEISNLTVVDQESEADFSLIKDKTFKVKTGGGGVHWYFQYEKDFKNAVRLLPFTDVRSEGGYCVTLGSRTTKGSYEVLDNCLVARMSNATKELLISGKKPVSQPGYVASQIQKGFALNLMAELYQGSSTGSRNDDMVRYIGYLLKQISPEEWETKAWPLTKEANQKNTPPLGEYELRNSYESIRRTEESKNKDVWVAQETEKRAKLSDNLPVKETYKTRYTWGTKGLDMNFAIIKRGNFIVLGARSGSGKTTFAFDMAQKNALLGHKVLFISLEMDEKEVKDAVARRSAGITIEEEYNYEIPEDKQKYFEEKISEINAIGSLYFKGVRRGGGLKWEELLEIIYGYSDLDLVFIDNLDLIEGNKGENDLDRQKRIVKKIMGFTSEKRIPIVLIHHYRKAFGKNTEQTGSLDDLSGSMKIVDGADRIINIRRNYNPEAQYPDKYMSVITLQKGREYANSLKSVFFINGTFVDTAPAIINYDPLKEMTPIDYLKENALMESLEREHREQEAQASMFGNKD